MLATLVQKLFGSRNQRIVNKYKKIVEQINSLESTISKLPESELAAKTEFFKSELTSGKTLDQILPEAFAVVREVAKRKLNMRHFDVQLVGGIALHNGKIAEMSTGEGKTLVATLAAYLNAIAGKGVHVVTVNDYLAKRDANWMNPIYEFLGLTVGSIVAGMNKEERKQAYSCDIVYGTNNEFGFDYLRDNMSFSLEDKVQRDLFFAIVDEVDSILIDEARTPLIISGMLEDSSELYIKLGGVVPQLTRQLDENGPGDYSVDEKAKQVFLTEAGHANVEEILAKNGLITEGKSLYNAANISLLHYLYASLRAHLLFHKDVDYIIQDGKIVIVDEHTGRTMPGRRWSEGLHQAVEAKEGLQIQSENQTLASITFQNYFRLYNKLSGMTGTADTEAYEFQTIYGLEVIVIPTNKPCVRKDASDLIFLTQKEKFAAIIEDIEDCIKRQQPVLVGTVSIEVSEFLSKLLKKHKIEHQVLNAKFHEKEAQIIAQAGKPGTVTIATNMAGRGTDIVLGGNYKALAEIEGVDSQDRLEKMHEHWQKMHETVIKAGGLHIIGTERHESRRIDNQLRGRSGRQGDPGSSCFYLSLEDNLMRIFASERVGMLMRKLGMNDGEAITHPWVSKAIENAQRKVEGRNFDIRKQLLEFDDVANDQRKVIYAERSDLMQSDDLSENVENLRADVLETVIAEYIPVQSVEEQWDIAGLENELRDGFNIELPINDWLKQDESLEEEGLKKKIITTHGQMLKDKLEQLGDEQARHLEKSIMLHALDSHWKEHLAQMDHLRQNVSLRSYAQKDPKQEYKREAFELFGNMLATIKRDIIMLLSKVEIRSQEEIEQIEQQRREAQDLQLNYKHDNMQSQQAENPNSPFVQQDKVGRNEPCPCGSGKKYKHCHGKIAANS